MTKHVPRVQFVEKTVESAQLQIIEKIDETSKIQTVQEHFAVLAQLASHISAILKFADETGEDPFVKVKSLTTDLINKLQDTLEWLDKNHLEENDELGFEQACVSEHFPEKRGRNSNPESEVFMARIFQIWVHHSRSVGPGSKSRQFSGETNRPGQSKQRQVWVRFEGQTKAVDVGGTEEEVRKRIQTAIGGAREEEMYMTSQGRRETWESVAAMENGRVVEVTVKMRGGMGKKRNKKDRNPWNTPSSGSEPDRISSADETHQQQTASGERRRRQRTTSGGQGRRQGTTSGGRRRGQGTTSGGRRRGQGTESSERRRGQSRASGGRRRGQGTASGGRRRGQSRANGR